MRVAGLALAGAVLFLTAVLADAWPCPLSTVDMIGMSPLPAKRAGTGIGAVGAGAVAVAVARPVALRPVTTFRMPPPATAAQPAARAVASLAAVPAAAWAAAATVLRGPRHRHGVDARPEATRHNSEHRGGNDHRQRGHGR